MILFLLIVSFLIILRIFSINNFKRQAISEEIEWVENHPNYIIKRLMKEFNMNDSQLPIFLEFIKYAKSIRKKFVENHILIRAKQLGLFDSKFMIKYIFTSLPELKPVIEYYNENL